MEILMTQTYEEYLKDVTTISDENKSKIIYISRDTNFNVTDTYDFSKDFLKSNYLQGLEKGKNFNLSKLSIHNK